MHPVLRGHENLHRFGKIQRPVHIMRRLIGHRQPRGQRREIRSFWKGHLHGFGRLINRSPRPGQFEAVQGALLAGRGHHPHLHPIGIRGIVLLQPLEHQRLFRGNRLYFQRVATRPAGHLHIKMPVSLVGDRQRPAVQPGGDIQVFPIRMMHADNRRVVSRLGLD